MLTVACYLWFDAENRHNGKHVYGPDDVRLLRRMVARHLTVLHDFAVITDRPELFARDADIRAVPIDWATHVPNTCFVKLMTFHPNMANWIGERVLVMDLDTVIVGNMDALADRHEDLVLWRNPIRIPWDNPTKSGRSFYNTSVVYHASGTRPNIWTTFDQDSHPKIMRDDQWYLSDLLGPDMPFFDGETDGVYRLGREDTPGSGVSEDLPENATIVFFPGDQGKPWLPEVAEKCKWIQKHRW